MLAGALAGTVCEILVGHATGRHGPGCGPNGFLDQRGHHACLQGLSPDSSDAVGHCGHDPQAQIKRRSRLPERLMPRPGSRK